MTHRLVLIRDEGKCRDALATLLSEAGFSVDCISEPAGILADRGAIPDLVLMDAALAGDAHAGIKLCKTLRRLSRHVLLVIYANSKKESDRALAFRAGVDAYLTTDLGNAYLITRLASLLLRRDQIANCDPIASGHKTCGPLNLDTDRWIASWDGLVLDMPLCELRILDALLDRPGEVKSNDALMKAAHIVVQPNTIAAHIHAIRRRFRTVDPGFDCIRSERGAGYRWRAMPP